MKAFLYLLVSLTYAQTVLWNQQDEITQFGFPSVTLPDYTSMLNSNEPAEGQWADDFDVPVGYTWTVQLIQTNGGYYGSPIPVPLGWKVQIWSNKAAQYLTPLSIIYNQSLVPIGVSSVGGIFHDSEKGNLGDPSPTFSLTNPPTLNSGKYWMSVMAVMSGNGENPTWITFARNTTKGNFQGSADMSNRDTGTPAGTPPYGSWVSGAQITLTPPLYELSFSISGAQNVAPATVPSSTFQSTTVAAMTTAVSSKNAATSQGQSAAQTTQQTPSVSVTNNPSTSTSPTQNLPTGISNYPTSSQSSSGPAQIQNGSGSTGGSNSGVVAGAVVGTIVGLILVVLAIFGVIFYRRKHKVDTPSSASIPTSKGKNFGSQGLDYSKAPNLGTSSSFSNESTSRPPSNAGVFEIDYKDLEIEKEIGRGDFGVVFAGRWRGGPVAIKQLIIRSDITEKEVSEFKREATVMAQLRPHANVVQFLGITAKPHICIITELLDQGSLYTYVFSNSSIDSTILSNFAKGIAAGMLHLHTEGIVHRDLATRNILLGAGLQVKVADFGLSRVCGDKQSNHTKSDTGPLKWMAPESIRRREYSTMSDVWAFGVTLYEIVARLEPYHELDPVQTAVEVTSNGLRLKAPDYTPLVVLEIMKGCFETEPTKRPDFAFIRKRFQQASAQEWAIRL